MAEAIDIGPLITQLQAQQSLQTQALAAALQGLWTGEGSVEAYLYALNPTLQGTITPNPPILESEVPKA